MSVGLQRVDSYLAAIIVSMTPFCIALFNRLLFGYRISLIQFSGITAGFLGVAMILYSGRNPAAAINPYLAYILVGLVSWALATSISHRVRTYPDNLVNSGLQMMIAGVIALTVSHFIYSPLTELVQSISPRSWLAMGYLATVGSAAYFAYVFLLANEPSIRIVSYAIVNPLIAVLLGIFLGHEKSMPLLAFGMPVTIIGLVFMLYGDGLAARLRKKPVSDRQKGKESHDVS
jgi:drug/metabolite transporter (DMT)-like permease